MPITPELTDTALTALFTGVIWVPIIVNRLTEMGPWKALKNPEPDVRPHADWAYRLANAHRNAIENFVVFAPLAIIVHQLQPGTPSTAMASAAFFYSRVAHAVIYTLGILSRKGEPDTVAIAEACAALTVELHRAEAELGQEFLAGDTVSAADFALYPLTAVLLRIATEAPQLGLHELLGPKLRSWRERVEALPCFASTWPPHWRAE